MTNEDVCEQLKEIYNVLSFDLDNAPEQLKKAAVTMSLDMLSNLISDVRKERYYNNSMGTHAAIIQKVEDGYKGIYLHWDGYPDYAGKMLDEHYTTNEKVTDLINLGSLSQLKREPNPQGKHSYDDPESDVCIAYHRDRGESLDIYYGATVQEVIDKVGYGDYVYVFEDGKWVEVG